MSQELFKVRPVRDYEGARYLAAPEEEAAAAEVLEERHHPMTYLVLMLLVFGLSIGLIGCYLRSDYQPDPPDLPPPIDPPDPPPGCDAALRCADGYTLETCDDGEWSAQSCSEYCTETLGWDSFSTGCDADAEDPCGCHYDVVDGGDMYCDPADLWCVDDATIEFCTDSSWYETMSCADYCHENFGPDYSSMVCDEAANPANPCGCFEDVLDGLVASCDPDDLRCADDWTVEVCVEGMMVATDCNSYCTETNGPDWYSAGCNAAAEDPCQCEYGMIDGGMIECEPEDVHCLDDQTVEYCAGRGYSTASCADYCVEVFGEGAVGGSCDDTVEGNPCQCEGVDSGSGE